MTRLLQRDHSKRRARAGAFLANDEVPGAAVRDGCVRFADGTVPTGGQGVDSGGGAGGTCEGGQGCGDAAEINEPRKAQRTRKIVTDGRG
jgi:hypothetical protein